MINIVLYYIILAVRVHFVAIKWCHLLYNKKKFDFRLFTLGIIVFKTSKKKNETANTVFGHCS